MSTDRNRLRRGARALASWTLAVAVGVTVGVLARAAQPAADAARAAVSEPTADVLNITTEAPRSARERRRAEKATANAHMPEASAVIASLAAEAAALGAPTAESVSVDSAPVCKDMKLTGSRVVRRVCQTPERAAASERAAEEYMRQIRDRTTIVVGQPQNPLQGR